MNAKGIAELAAAIMGITPLAPFKPIASGIAALLPDDKPDVRKQKELNWKIEHIPRWKTMCAQLMDISMKHERKAKLLKGKMSAEWFEFYGEAADDKVIERLHENVYKAVVVDMATAGLG